jgi:Mrp family chromosome partitioning ATPase
MLGLKGRGIHQSSTGWTPVFVDVGAGTGELGVMSVGFMLPDDDNAVIWRGPRKSGLIRQFLTEVDWGELDYLIIDTPPGTSDEHISVAQYLKMVDIGAIVVTTPQEVSMQDVRKELNFCAKTKIRVIGVLENMNQLLIPLSHLNFVERKTGRDQTEYVRGCALDNSPQSMAARFNVPYLGALPLDPSLQRACESGTCLVCQCQQHSPAFTPFVRLVDTMLSIITANKAKIPSQA